jgi:alanyl-tRNA synthetase
MEAVGEGEKRARKEQLAEEAERLTAAAEEVGGLVLVIEQAPFGDQKLLLELANRVQSKLGGPSAIVLGGGEGEKVGLVALVSKDATSEGVSAAAILREAAPVVGGGGGGREEMAQAGGRDFQKLGEALETARAAIGREAG